MADTAPVHANYRKQVQGTAPHAYAKKFITSYEDKSQGLSFCCAREERIPIALFR
jgi:hypothetical protein